MPALDREGYAVAATLAGGSLSSMGPLRDRCKNRSIDRDPEYLDPFFVSDLQIIDSQKRDTLKIHFEYRSFVVSPSHMSAGTISMQLCRENRAPLCVKVPGSSRAPDPLMVGIRSPDGLVVGLAAATREFWV